VGAVDEGLRQVYFSSLTQIFRERAQQTLEHAVLDPLLEPSVAGLIRRVASRHVCPWRSRPQHPHHTVEDRAGCFVRTPARGPRRSTLFGRQVRFDDLPLLVGEIHEQL
jgi:hypothetical protein